MNIYKIIEDELNEKLGYSIIQFDQNLFNNNIIFFNNNNNNMFFNKTMLLDLFSDSSNKLMIYNYIQSEDNIWPLEFLNLNKINYKKIDIKNIEINFLYKPNKIYTYYYYIDSNYNNWILHTSNQYKNHIIYIRAVNNLYCYLTKILSKSKKDITFKNYKHEELVNYCFNDKQLFQKYMNIIYINDNVCQEIEIDTHVSSVENLKHLLSIYNLGFV
jgi:hypothetical protein